MAKRSRARKGKCFTNPRTHVRMRRKTTGRGFTTKGC